MRDDLIQLERSVDGKPVFKRHFSKQDGRDLFLYGYTAHKEAPLPQETDALAKGGELRWHPLRKEWNIYAAHRQNRTFKPTAANNPLAPSKAGQNPTEIPFSDFELAVFENRFTSLHPEAVAPQSPSFLKTSAATGRCEVVVYAPEAKGSLATLGQERRRLLLSTWIDRYQALFDLGCNYVLPFENRGDEVGVTLHHPHGQIYGFSKLPRTQQNTAEAFAEGYDLADEIKSLEQNFTVREAGNLIAYCPPYARFPFEVWIAPKKAIKGPWELSNEDQDTYAFLLGDVCRRFDQYFETQTPYMMSLHAAPREHSGHYHFTTQFYPLLRAPGRVKYLASVEQSTGTFTVDVMPEFAAATLRSL